MPDELKPCPWCGSADIEIWKDRALLYDHETLSVVICNVCGNEVAGCSNTVESAIAAWNALPRKPVWMEYNGEEETLPPVNTKVLVETFDDFFTSKLHYVPGPGEHPYWKRSWTPVQKGHKWAPWPGEE